MPPASTGPCPKTFSKAASFKDLVSLLQEAEKRLSAAGITSLSDKLHALRGLYYGTTWSTDFKVLKSILRNTGFQVFTQTVSAPFDPRGIFNCGLFAALQGSQDAKDGVRQVDFGHLVIALDARNAAAPKISFTGFGGNGTEIVTWLGDIGGGCGMLAIKRATVPATRVSSVFKGTDFGGSINLEGDISGFVVARSGSTTLVPPVTIPSGKGIADAVSDFLTLTGKGTEWNDRATIFLQMYGATFDSSGNLTNRGTLVSAFAPKIQEFACQYLFQRVVDKKTTLADFRAATDHIIPCSEEVAETFVDALDDCHKGGARLEAKRFPSPKPMVPGACKALLAIVSASSKASQLKKTIDEWLENLKLPDL